MKKMLVFYEQGNVNKIAKTMNCTTRTVTDALRDKKVSRLVLKIRELARQMGAKEVVFENK